MEIHHYIHFPNDPTLEVLLRGVDRKLDLILSQQVIIMSAQSEAVDRIEANTAAIDGAGASAEAAFTELAALIQSLKDNATDPATVARIDALGNVLAARAASLGAAVEARPKA